MSHEITNSPSRPLPSVYTDLDAALRELAAFRFARAPVETSSRIPGGSYAHRLVDSAVGRHVDDVLRQAQRHADEVTRALTVLTEIVVQQLDDLQDGLAELRRVVNALPSSAPSG